MLSCSQILKPHDNCETSITKADFSGEPHHHAGVSARDERGTEQKTTMIWIFEADIGPVSRQAACYAFPLSVDCRQESVVD